MVAVYHGTTPDRFEKIKADKTISVTTKDNKSVQYYKIKPKKTNE